MGETQARFILENNKISPVQLVPLTSVWLAEKERKAKLQEEARQSEQMELMRRDSAAIERQARAAERANTRATVAIWVAVISAIISIVFLTLALFKH